MSVRVNIHVSKFMRTSIKLGVRTYATYANCQTMSTLLNTCNVLSRITYTVLPASQSFYPISLQCLLTNITAISPDLVLNFSHIYTTKSQIYKLAF